jgi:hypothetical protein
MRSWHPCCCGPACVATACAPHPIPAVLYATITAPGCPCWDGKTLKFTYDNSDGLWRAPIPGGTCESGTGGGTHALTLTCVFWDTPLDPPARYMLRLGEEATGYPASGPFSACRFLSLGFTQAPATYKTFPFRATYTNAFSDMSPGDCSCDGVIWTITVAATQASAAYCNMVTTFCCPNPIPPILYMTVTAPTVPCIDGITVPLYFWNQAWEPPPLSPDTGWYYPPARPGGGNNTFGCGETSAIQWWFRCVTFGGNIWGVTVFQAGNCLFSAVSAPVTTCDPFSSTFTAMYGGGACVSAPVAQSVTITITG